MKKFILSITLIILLLITTGCGQLFDELTTARYPEEELVVTGGFDSGIYVYSDKVHLHLSYQYEDYIEVRMTNNEDWLFKGYKVLEANIEKAAWNDFILFVQSDDKYYTFDIKNYEIGDTSGKGLSEYSKKDFKKAYPDYNEYEWYDH